jgi:hypothetical protein
MDCKDASTVPADPQGKQQHVVEVLNFVEAGTSILRKSLNPMTIFMPRSRLLAVVTFLRTSGLPPPPPSLTFDRDPRWVGSSSGRDFPSALRRFLRLAGHPASDLPAGIRPDKNAFVERSHRSYNQECLQVPRPGTLQEVREVTERFVQHYNEERPRPVAFMQESTATSGPSNLAHSSCCPRNGRS